MLRTEGSWWYNAASNFKISLRKNSETLHIQLTGDFDGTSAYQLIHVLRNHSRTFTRILINTGSDGQ